MSSPAHRQRGARRIHIRTAWLAVLALLVHTWLPFVVQALPEAPAEQRGAASVHDHADASAPQLPPREPAAGGPQHHAPAGAGLEIECPLCIVAQIAKVFSDAAPPGLPPVAAARGPAASRPRRRRPRSRPTHGARPRAPPPPDRFD